MKYILAILVFLIMYSCQIPVNGVNKFNEVYKGMPKAKVRNAVKDQPFYSNRLVYNNQNYTFDAFQIQLSTYTEEHDEYRPSYSRYATMDRYEVTTTTDYYFPYVILYLDDKVFFQGFIWEYKNHENRELNQIGEQLRRQINVE